MKRSYLLIFAACCLCFSAFLLGCGDGPGAPGTEGSEDTGLDARIFSVSHSDPAGDTGDEWQLDLYQSDCDGEPEEWGDDYANISFSASVIYTQFSDNVLYITNYKVTFIPLSPDYPPIDEIRAGIQGGYYIRPMNIDGPYPFLILDFGRKFEIQDLIARGVYPANFPFLYNMTLEMWGQDFYGQDFTAPPLIRVIELGPYNKC